MKRNDLFSFGKDPKRVVYEAARRFQGEMMECAICHKQQRSDPKVESNWNYIELDGDGYYVCPKCYPDSRKLSQKKYAEKFQKLILKLQAIRGNQHRRVN